MPVSRGARPGYTDNSNDMAAAYVAFIPPLQYNKEEHGNHRLTNQELEDFVAFLNKLSDGLIYEPS